MQIELNNILIRSQKRGQKNSKSLECYSYIYALSITIGFCFQNYSDLFWWKENINFSVPPIKGDLFIGFSLILFELRSRKLHSYLCFHGLEKGKTNKQKKIDGNILMD